MAKKLPIIEIFGPTIQGEGYLIGAPTHFVRTGGCTYRCEWCDSLFAVLPEEVKKNATRMEVHEIISKVAELPPAPWVTISGGDPCMHKGLHEVVLGLQQQGYRVAVETQGALWQDWLLDCNAVTFSPKGPSSGNITDIAEFVSFASKAVKHTHVIVKPVVFNPADLEYALALKKALTGKFGRAYNLFVFQAGTVHDHNDPDGIRDRIMDNTRALVEQLILKESEGFTIFDADTRILPQLHAAVWPNIERGV